MRDAMGFPDFLEHFPIGERHRGVRCAMGNEQWRITRIESFDSIDALQQIHGNRTTPEIEDGLPS